MASSWTHRWSPIACLVAGVVLALACWLRARALPPLELPALHLPPAQTQAVLRADQRRAKAQSPSPLLSKLRTLVRAQGEAELRETSALGGADRRRAIEALVDELRSDPEAFRALRSALVEEAAKLFQEGGTEAEERALLGSFPAMLERYDVTHGAELQGPFFVLRTLYKARLNLIFGVSPVQGMARIERLAYWGWLALGAGSAPSSDRLAALKRYAELGGEGAREAEAALRFHAGDPERAAVLLREAYRRLPHRRLRNLASGAMQGGSRAGQPHPPSLR